MSIWHRVCVSVFNYLVLIRFKFVCIKVVTHFVILHCRLMFLLFYIKGRITLIKQKYHGPNTGQLH